MQAKAAARARARVNETMINQCIYEMTSHAAPPPLLKQLNGLCVRVYNKYICNDNSI